MLELLALLVACPPPLPGFTDTRPPPGSTIPADAKILLLGYPHPSPEVTISDGTSVYTIIPTQENGIMTVDIGALGVTGSILLVATVDDPSAMPLPAEFTVATDTDLIPPEFLGLESLSFQYNEESPGTCTPGGFQVLAQVPPAKDDWSMSYYELYEVLPNDGLRWAASRPHFSDDQPATLYAYPGPEEGTRCYVAFAYDVAGNVTEEGVRGGVCIDLTLGGTDAGFEDSGSDDALPLDTGVADSGVADSGAKADSGTGGLMLEEDGGCGCTSAPARQSSALFLPLLLLGAVIRSLRKR